MEKTNFWNDAARCGVLVAAVQILSSLAGILWPSALLSLLSVVVLVMLLYVLVKQRAAQQGNGESGFSYGQGMKYIFWIMVFAGILSGAWEIVARNALFTEQYETALNESLSVLANIYTDDQLELAVTMSRTMMFSPIWVVVLTIVGSVIQGCFFGLLISAPTRREPQIFSEQNPKDED